MNGWLGQPSIFDLEDYKPGFVSKFWNLCFSFFFFFWLVLPAFEGWIWLYLHMSCIFMFLPCLYDFQLWIHIWKQWHGVNLALLVHVPCLHVSGMPLWFLIMNSHMKAMTWSKFGFTVTYRLSSCSFHASTVFNNEFTYESNSMESEYRLYLDIPFISCSCQASTVFSYAFMN